MEPGTVIKSASLSLPPNNFEIAGRTFLADEHAIVFAPPSHSLPEPVVIERAYRVALGVPIGWVAIDQHILRMKSRIGALLKLDVRTLNPRSNLGQRPLKLLEKVASAVACRFLGVPCEVLASEAQSKSSNRLHGIRGPCLPEAMILLFTHVSWEP
tara:strand:+ start:893 stop:1360 length:468 start_codon:yes stop_codon:yes gene_type:complete